MARGRAEEAHAEDGGEEDLGLVGHLRRGGTGEILGRYRGDLGLVGHLRYG